MAIGGFTGSDPILTSARLTALVKAGVVRYFLLNGGGFGGFGGLGGSSNGTATSWVQAHCTAVPSSKYGSGGAGSGTLYDCGAST